MTGIIYECVGGVYSVKTENGFISCQARGLFRKDDTVLLTGDRVTVENDIITEIMPRKNSLIRPPVANIDKLFLVVAVASPDPCLYNIDKMLAVATYNAIDVLIIVNKLDLDGNYAKELCDIYTLSGYKTVMFSANSPEPEKVALIREYAKGKVSFFAGASGSFSHAIAAIVASAVNNKCLIEVFIMFCVLYCFLSLPIKYPALIHVYRYVADGQFVGFRALHVVRIVDGL